MRLSRNRNWGHPRLVAYLERLAKDARSVGWSGLLIGDLSQPRGVPCQRGTQAIKLAWMRTFG